MNRLDVFSGAQAEHVANEAGLLPVREAVEQPLSPEEAFKPFNRPQPVL